MKQVARWRCSHHFADEPSVFLPIKSVHRTSEAGFVVSKHAHMFSYVVVKGYYLMWPSGVLVRI